MIPAEEALPIVLRVAQRLPPVSVPLHEALGKVLAEDITAPDPLPPYPASIKDGYAVVAADGPGEYPVITESRAGNDGVGVTVSPGTVAYVTTGGPIPEGADAVVQVEDTEVITGDSIEAKRVRIWECDINKDDVVLKSGERLGAAEMGLLVTAGVTTVKVYPSPTIAVLSTGDELVEPTTANLGRGQDQSHARTILPGQGFAKTSGTHFVMNGRRLYLNGFNAYWLMNMAVDPSTRAKVTITFQQASKEGMNVARTWAFSDGGYGSLQSSPGLYNENVFKGLDFVVAEARKHGVYLILTLVNNWDDYGGKKQYVEWARDRGQSLNSNDDFFTNPVIKGYFKNHVKTVLTRVNSISGVAYKDDPTIFAWELMNEPRCQSDLSGKPLQDWITEMAAYVKSIDKNHLLQIGLEGFYGDSMPEKKQFNPGYQVGTDFISNNRIPGVDFTTIHLYPDQWVLGSNEEARAAFVEKWIKAHIQDSNSVIQKPILLSEFSMSSKSPGYSMATRDNFFKSIYDTLYTCASSGGPCGGGLFWQLLAQGMDNFRDGYEVVLEESPSTASIIAQQSQKLSALGS